MAVVIGTLGRDVLRGVLDEPSNEIIGDPFTAGAFFDPSPGTSVTLSSGQGGNDLILAPRIADTGQNIAFGDAYLMEGVGRGGNDALLGDVSSDDLSGDAYEMSGTSVGGNDLLVGGGDFDDLAGDAGSEMTGNARGGHDILRGGDADDDCWGDTITMRDSARGGNDLIDAGGGDDGFVYGDASGMRDQAVGGNDIVSGGDGDDTMHGDGNSMSDNAQGGNDLVHGGGGDDEFEGDGNFFSGTGTIVCGDDRLFGDAGDDEMFGDARSTSTTAVCGDDGLRGGVGDDLLYGDVRTIDPGGSITAGSDIFGFGRGSGNDTVGDFNDAAVGAQDRLDLRGYAGLDSFADLTGFISQSAADTVIDLSAAAGRGAGLDTITLLSTTATDFGANDFLF